MGRNKVHREAHKTESCTAPFRTEQDPFGTEICVDGCVAENPREPPPVKAQKTVHSPTNPEPRGFTVEIDARCAITPPLCTQRGHLGRFSYDAYASAMCHDVGMISRSPSR